MKKKFVSLLLAAALVFSLGVPAFAEGAEALPAEPEAAVAEAEPEAVTEIREYLQNPQEILPEYRKRCPHCSLYEICAPKNVMTQKYLERIWDHYVHTE